MAKKSPADITAVLLAGVLAGIVPGAGHVYLRRTLRGVIICVCINVMFWAGVAFGGVFTVQPRTEKWWFAAQMCTGVSGLAGWYRQDRQHKKIVSDMPEDLRTLTPPRSTREPGDRHSRWQKAYEVRLVAEGISLTYPTSIVARAYTGVAGMLNLMCIFDAVMLAIMGRFGEPPPDNGKSDEEETG